MLNNVAEVLEPGSLLRFADGTDGSNWISLVHKSLRNRFQTTHRNGNTFSLKHEQICIAAHFLFRNWIETDCWNSIQCSIKYEIKMKTSVFRSYIKVQECTCNMYVHVGNTSVDYLLWLIKFDLNRLDLTPIHSINYQCRDNSSSNTLPETFGYGTVHMLRKPIFGHLKPPPSP